MTTRPAPVPGLALPELDPDSSQPVSHQIAGILRAAILTGQFPPGGRLPSQPWLAAHFGVARETVKRALDTLRGERLIVTRQGAGVFVRTHRQPVDVLTPAIGAAVARGHATIDFAGTSAEPLRDALVAALRASGHPPAGVTVRLLLPAEAGPAGTTTSGPTTPPRDETTRHTTAPPSQLPAPTLGMMAAVQVRNFPAAPTADLYLLNRDEALFGFNARPSFTTPSDRERHHHIGASGGIILFRYSAGSDDASHASRFVASARAWFDATWDSATSAVGEC